MAQKYNPHNIEAKWRDIWPKERESFNIDPSKEQYYTLDMISYPSSEGLHMGHWRPYTISDVWARYQTLQGKQVLSPVGFDSFGLPAENAAIKFKSHPNVFTQKAIANFTRQIQEMGKMYDWSTLFAASSPEYYKWTQWIFTELFNNGLAYRKSAVVNWCPKDQTVLANEQVEDGKCERCKTEVEKKELKQWFLKITDFADELLNFEGLDWPERVKTLQTNWIGKSKGAELSFLVDGQDAKIAVFTTRPDTLFGVTYIVVAPEYKNLEALVTTDNKEAVEAYIAQATKKSEIERMAEEKDKTGVFTGSYAINPINNQKVPIWVADYVLATYGTGAVMAVPAHDERDYAFAQKYELPIVHVIEPSDGQGDIYAGQGILKNSGQFDGMESQEALPQIVAAAGGSMKTTYRLHDWLVSRQRYWGTPIPIIYCDTCGEVAVPEKDLPVLLPEDAEFLPDGGSPLERHPDFKNVTCPTCGGNATRETDTLDTFVDSSWYFLRYPSPRKTDGAFDKEQVKAWLPVDFYVGGTEHSILHLLYARFVMRALHKLGHVPYAEPFQTFYGNGMVFLNGAKMSKSKGNVINPDDIIKKYGTDAMRGYILFMGPSDQDVEWQENGITGVSRFLQKAWNVFHNTAREGETIHPAIQEAFSKISELLPAREFNRCISSLMIALNDIGSAKMNKTEAKVLAQLMAPFFPHFAEEVWQQLGESESIFASTWPKVEVAAKTTVEYAIQVNGRLKGTLIAKVSDTEQTVVTKAKDVVNNSLSSKTVVKTVFVPGRIVNFVVQ